MNKCKWIPILLPLGLAVTCIPAIDLKQRQEFTPALRKTLRAADACGLKGYFVAHPKLRTAATERTVGHKSNWLEYGEVTVKVGPGPQLEKLRALLGLLYRNVPRAVLGSSLTLKLDFIRRIGEPRGKDRKLPQPPKGVLVVRPDHEIKVKAGGKTYHLAYHPCIADLLFPPPKRNERSKTSDKLHDAL